MSIRLNVLRIAALVFIIVTSFAYAETPDPEKREDNLGRKYAQEVEKQYKIVRDPDIIDRVKRIGEALAANANSVEVPASYGTSDIIKFNYEFTVVEEKDPNAFSLPGGKIYVNTGLLDLVTSDDELAGVLAHEIAHAAHHHVMKLLNEQSKIDRYVALIALAGIVGKARSEDLNNLLLGASMVRQGSVSGRTMQAERDADRTAVSYLAKSTYNPIGFVDFMGKLEKLHDENPTQPLGIYQTHPAPFRRVASIRKALLKCGVKVDMRKIRGVAFANAVESPKDSGRYSVMVCGLTFYTPPAKDSSQSKTKAEEVAEELNNSLDMNMRPEDITISDDGTSLLGKGKVILKVDKKETGDNSEKVRAILSLARATLIKATWADWVVNTCEPASDDPDDL